MPIGLEVNDFDSDEDMSSTEDDTVKVPIVNKKNKKLKSKVKTQNSILKESKIVKDNAKKTIKNMESELNDLEFFDYLKDKSKNEEEREINNFFTDDELLDQFKELERLKKIQKQLWKVNNSHVGPTEIQQRALTISSGIGSLFDNKLKNNNNNNSRTQLLNTTSRINTRIPIMSSSRIINRSYNNIGKMW